jgi:hypothetical protein
MMIGGAWAGRNFLFGGEQNSQGGTPAGEPGFDRPQIDLEDVCDLFVGKAFDLAQHDDGAEGVWHLAQSRLDTHMEFLLRSVIKGRATRIGQRRAEG